jgi:putative tricarboxylic transport membrane protein
MQHRTSALLICINSRRIDCRGCEVPDFIRLLGALLVLTVLLYVAPHATAQGWKPVRPVAFIAGAAAGSSSIDLTARTLQRVWDDSRAIGMPVVVINKPGASNGIAWSYLNERSEDGHSIAIGTTNLVSNPIMGAHSIGHRDVTPLAILFDDYIILLVRADSPLRSMADVRQRLIKDPAALSFGLSPGLGGGAHAAAALVVKALGVDASNGRYVPFKGASEAITAMIAGDIDIVSASTVNAPPFLAAGRSRAIGVIAPQRLSGSLAGVPTVREQGVNAEFTNWRAVIGPKGMRKEQVAFWVQALAVANKSDAWQKDLLRNFWRENFLTGRAADEFLEKQASVYRTLWAEISVKK